MPRIIRTRGICLASRRLRETSKLVTYYTDNYGKLTFLCKGARNPKSKFGSALELFSLSELIFYRTESKLVYILSEANLIESFTNLKNPQKFIYASQMIELILRAIGYEDSNYKLFHLLYAALKILNHSHTKKSSDSLLGAYLIKAITLLGFRPQFNHCVLCSRTVGLSPRSVFSIEKGGALCASDKHPTIKNTYGINHIKTIKYLLSKPLSKSLQLSIDIVTLKLIQDYLTYHLEKIKFHSFDFTSKLTP